MLLSLEWHRFQRIKLFKILWTVFLSNLSYLVLSLYEEIEPANLSGSWEWGSYFWNAQNLNMSWQMPMHGNVWM